MMKIITGGQTGVDRAALDASLDRKTPCGGFCPKGRKAEDGVIPEQYPLNELASDAYRDRTLKNVQESDGTLIIYSGEIVGGTKETLLFCTKENKPFQLIDANTLSPEEASHIIKEFCQNHHIECLNVAGPRASEAPHIYDYAYESLILFLNL